MMMRVSKHPPSMAMSVPSVSHATPVSSAIPQYQVPSTPKAKLDDERTESVAIRQREAATGKDAAVPSSTGGVNTIA
jgi:hypothetical protein